MHVEGRNKRYYNWLSGKFIPELEVNSGLLQEASKGQQLYLLLSFKCKETVIVCGKTASPDSTVSALACHS